MNELLGRLRSVLDGLAPRERLMLSAAGSILLLIIAYLLLVQPVLDARERARQRVTGAEQQLTLMVRLRQDFDEVNGRLSAVEQRIQSGPRGNIFTLLESLASQSGVKVESMEPQTALASERYQETKVEVVLKGVTLAQAVGYLHQIETSPQLLSVKSLRLRTRRDKPEMLDATFTVSSFEPAA